MTIYIFEKKELEEIKLLWQITKEKRYKYK